jgi:hypothetical protein
MKSEHQRTLELIFALLISGCLPWRDIEALSIELEAEVGKRAGSVRFRG